MVHDFSLVFDTENPLWKNVLEIFESNESYPKKCVKGRSLHHKFPRSFSKLLNEDVDNDSDNLVSLSLADHFMIHYYYYKLGKNQYKAKMALAFTYMLNCNFEELSSISPEIAEQLSKEYELNETEILKEIGKNHIGSKRNEETIVKMKEAWVKRKESGYIYVPTEEAKRKQSEALKGIKKSEEHCKHISEGRKGIKFTEEHCKNQQESRNNTISNMSEEERKEKFGKSMRGKHPVFTEEHNKKISQSKMGHSVSDEARRKMSEAKKGLYVGRKLSEETKKKIAEAKTGVKREPMKEGQKETLSKLWKGKHWRIVNGKREWY